MLRDSYRIISARGNCKELTESDFCFLPCTPNILFLARITSKFIYNVGAQRFFVLQVTQLFGKNNSIFSLGALREKLSPFDLKVWVKILLRQ